MKRVALCAAALACGLFTENAARADGPAPKEEPKETWVPADLALLSRARVAFWVDKPVIAPLSLNVVGSANYGVTGLETGGIYNYSYGSIRGIQVAGITNVVEKDVVGLQVAGIVNVVDGDMGGISASFIGNGAKNSRGISVAGVFEGADRDIVGIHVAGLVSLALRDLSGLQVSTWNAAFGSRLRGVQVGLANTDHSVTFSSVSGNVRTTTSWYNPNHDASLTGLQIGAVNWAYNVEGAQIGVVNFVDYGGRGLFVGLGGIANGEAADGAQSLDGISIEALSQVGKTSRGLFVSAVLNYTKVMKGVQIAPFNVTKKLEGLQIGIVNVATEAPIPVLPVVNFGW